MSLGFVNNHNHNRQSSTMSRLANTFETMIVLPELRAKKSQGYCWMYDLIVFFFNVKRCVKQDNTLLKTRMS